MVVLGFLVMALVLSGLVAVALGIVDRRSVGIECLGDFFCGMLYFPAILLYGILYMFYICGAFNPG